ncbi:MAG: hypothetical protein H7Y59_06070 [Anaerolineales bacterium]|nr:hypothetical protein [Anaerolineales bacterium]
MRRFPLSINIVELLVAIAAALASWLGLYAFLLSMQPWPGNYVPIRQLTVWFLNGGDQILFNEFRIYLPLIMAISAIFLVRTFKYRSVRYFSFWSNIASAWPLALFPLVSIFSYFSLYCFPVGIIFSVFSLIELFTKSSKPYSWIGSTFALMWNIVCIVVAGNYCGKLWELYGD